MTEGDESKTFCFLAAICKSNILNTVNWCVANKKTPSGFLQGVLLVETIIVSCKLIDYFQLLQAAQYFNIQYHIKQIPLFSLVKTLVIACNF